MIIRKATSKDITGLENLLTQVLDVHHQGRPDIFKANTRKYSSEELYYIIKNPLTPVFVAVDEEDSVLAHCFAKFIQFSDDNVLTPVKTLYIDDLCVDESIRGTGVGKAVFRFVRDFAIKEQCHNITLNVWACNEKAMKFYQSLGLSVQKICMEEIL